VDDYIKYLFEVKHPNRQTKPYYPSYGVQYYGRHATLIFYNKYKECMEINIKDLLREELSLVNKTSVRRAFGDLKKPLFITDFTPDVVERILQKENAKLVVCHM
jgi:hypothetical protein